MCAVDLHTHSDRSDGSLSPEELIKLAAKKGLTAIALTDHDTVDGLDRAIECGNSLGIEVIPGVELSCDNNGKDVHIVGLYIDYKRPSFNKYLKEFVDSRDNRNKKMCHLLTEAGMPVDYEEMTQYFGDCVLTRAHYARYLLMKGYTKSLKEAFERYIGDNCPYYVPREKVTPAQGVDLILKAGGIPILAHPLLYKMGKDSLEMLVDKLIASGLMGIETNYCTYTQSDQRDMIKLAEKKGLLKSGGSDFHGEAKPGLELGTGYGSLYVPDEYLNLIKEKIQK